MHPAIFIGACVLLGMFFALQEWMSLRLWSSYRVHIAVLFEAWGVYYLIWGILCWLLWFWLGERIKNARPLCIVTRVLPLSIAVSVVQEMIWVACFPNLPMNRPRMDYWHRFAIEMTDEPFNNLVIFWCAFWLFRGIGYYQRYREKEDAAAKLEVELANAQIAALRMQLNPHFLFNTMNGISSLMRTDVSAADTMLEQLGSLLRITLKRGDAQLIAMRDELDFIELYLAMQDRRFGNRVRQSIDIEAELHDALVPAMILQPIVENAYAHGLSKLERAGVLAIKACREGNRLRVSVVNSGVGLREGRRNLLAGGGVGLANVRGRLKLHYGVEQTFLIREVDEQTVEVTLTFPLQLSELIEEPVTRFGG
jgi:two-component system LytT family sensor kinase